MPLIWRHELFWLKWMLITRQESCYPGLLPKFSGVSSGAPTFILPVSALIFRAQGLQVGLVKDGNRADLASIILGRDFGGEVEVVSGLQADDAIIVNPPDSLISGETVRVAEAQPQGQKTSSGGGAK